MVIKAAKDIKKAKKYNIILKIAILYFKDNFLLITLLNYYLMIFVY